MCRSINKLVFSLVLGSLAAASSTPAAASPITVTFEKVGPGIGNAGQYNWNTGSIAYEGILYTPYANNSSSQNHIVMFCIERNQFINNNTTYSGYHFANLENAPVPGTVMSSAIANAIRAMWAEYRDDLNVGTTTEKNEKSAAFQHAVWRLLDPSYNPSLSGNTLNNYNAFLNPSNWKHGLANLAAIVHSQHQDQIFELERGYIVTPGGNLLLVPAPATLVIAVLIAPALVLRRRLATKML
jgi:hypothetical protein